MMRTRAAKLGKANACVWLLLAVTMGLAGAGGCVRGGGPWAALERATRAALPSEGATEVGHIWDEVRATGVPEAAERWLAGCEQRYLIVAKLVPMWYAEAARRASPGQRVRTPYPVTVVAVGVRGDTYRLVGNAGEPPVSWGPGAGPRWAFAYLDVPFAGFYSAEVNLTEDHGGRVDAPEAVALAQAAARLRGCVARESARQPQAAPAWSFVEGECVYAIAVEAGGRTQTVVLVERPLGGWRESAMKEPEEVYGMASALAFEQLIAALGRALPR